ncbi:MAG TPA: ATP-binding cassette domain-containing protein, partial [Microlunatus sp.]|nr:ATP-binding cassette domain-containing protein [Microlunatus sp.]
MIEFESVSKTFRDGTTAVDNLSLVVPSGQITVIVGPSGCGKTTSLRMVNRMLEPTKGKITWDGKPVKSRRKTALRRQMGYVIQSGGLFPHRTVLENIATVPDLLRWDKQKSRKRAVELLGSVGLDRKLGARYPAQLSGGQQQRVGVARALAADPLVLLMDEPFSAVDPVVRGELHEFFLGLQRELSKTIIMITHDIDEAIKLGDQVAILRVGGKLAQVGTPQQLLDEPADAFVEGFVGKDRGYRSLSFQPASGLTLGGVQVVREAGVTSGDAPVLVVDGDARPVGWSDPARAGSVMALGATFDPENDSLRTALDAALTSPVGLAVAVTGESRRYAGVVDADMILQQVTQTRAQIAESIAVRTHDEPATADDSPPPPADAPLDDPDATAVRGVPAVESVGTVAAVGAAAGAAAWPEDEDPDATRIAGPLADADDQIAPEPVAETQPEPELEQRSEWPAETASEPQDELAGQPEPGPWSDRTASAGPEQEPAAEEARSDQPYAEPYGSEVPPVGDESTATAYDAQLARDEEVRPVDATPAPEPTPAAEPTWEREPTQA